MKTLQTSISVVLGLALLAILGVGAYLLIQHLSDLYVTLDRQLASILVTVIIAVLIIVFGIQHASQSSGLRRFRLEKRALAYSQLINTLAKVLKQKTSEPPSDLIPFELKAAEQQFLLWTSAGVLKQYVTLQRLHSENNNKDKAIARAAEKMLREMRRDLGQSNFSLNERDLSELFNRKNSTRATRTRDLPDRSQT